MSRVDTSRWSDREHVLALVIQIALLMVDEPTTPLARAKWKAVRAAWRRALLHLGFTEAWALAQAADVMEQGLAAALAEADPEGRA